jgi:hypothetical protein
VGINYPNSVQGRRQYVGLVWGKVSSKKINDAGDSELAVKLYGASRRTEYGVPK